MLPLRLAAHAWGCQAGRPGGASGARGGVQAHVCPDAASPGGRRAAAQHRHPGLLLAAPPEHGAGHTRAGCTPPGAHLEVAEEGGLDDIIQQRQQLVPVDALHRRIRAACGWRPGGSASAVAALLAWPSESWGAGRGPQLSRAWRWHVGRKAAQAQASSTASCLCSSCPPERMQPIYSCCTLGYSFCSDGPPPLTAVDHMAGQVACRILAVGAAHPLQVRGVRGPGQLGARTPHAQAPASDHHLYLGTVPLVAFRRSLPQPSAHSLPSPISLCAPPHLAAAARLWHRWQKRADLGQYGSQAGNCSGHRRRRQRRLQPGSRAFR